MMQTFLGVRWLGLQHWTTKYCFGIFKRTSFSPLLILQLTSNSQKTGSKILTQGASRFKAWQYKGSSIYQTMPSITNSAGPGGMSISPNGKRLIAGGNFWRANLYNLDKLRKETWVAAKPLDRKQQTVHFLDDQTILCSADDGIRQFHLIQGRRDSNAVELVESGKLFVGPQSNVGCFAMDANAKKMILFRSSLPARIELHDLSQEPPRVDPLEYDVARHKNYFSPTVSVSEDGKFGAIAGVLLGSTIVWDLETQKIVYENAEVSRCATFSPDSKWLVITDALAYHLIDTQTWKSKFSIPVNEMIKADKLVAFNGDSSLAVMVTSLNEYSLWSVADSRLVASFELPRKDRITQLNFGRYGRKIFMNSLQGTIQVVDLAKASELLSEIGLGMKGLFPEEQTKQDTGSSGKQVCRRIYSLHANGLFSFHFNDLRIKVADSYTMTRANRAVQWFPQPNKAEMVLDFEFAPGNYFLTFSGSGFDQANLQLELNGEIIEGFQFGKIDENDLESSANRIEFDQSIQRAVIRLLGPPPENSITFEYLNLVGPNPSSEQDH